MKFLPRSNESATVTSTDLEFRWIPHREGSRSRTPLFGPNVIHERSFDVAHAAEQSNPGEQFGGHAALLESFGCHSFGELVGVTLFDQAEKLHIEGSVHPTHGRAADIAEQAAAGQDRHSTVVLL